MFKTLYICYFGLREPLVQTQVLPYLREIRKGGIEISLLTFEQDLKSRWPVEQVSRERSLLASEGIDWHCLEYHKWPSVPATLYDLIRGTLFIREFIAKSQPDVLHGRVHLPTLMGALARKLSKRKPKLLFDIRGFFPEEYADAGIWPKDGLMYRLVKRVERWLVSESDGFIVLTENARRLMFPESAEGGRDKHQKPVEVIPCCVDFGSRFAGDVLSLRSSFRTKLGIEGRFVIIHVGALGGLYLADELADFVAFAKAVNPETFAIFLTQSDPQKILPLLKERGLKETDCFVGCVPASEIQGYLCASDVGLTFVKIGSSTVSRSPTKIPEYLACGLRLVSNTGIGDVDDLLRRNKVGSLVDEFSDDAYCRVLTEIEELGDVGQTCMDLASMEFDLSTVGGERYRRMYRRLMEIE